MTCKVQRGVPVECGEYVVYSEKGTFLFEWNSGWFYRNTTVKVPFEIWGWIGPLPIEKKDFDL